jgi:hypothetical protein
LLISEANKYEACIRKRPKTEEEIRGFKKFQNGEFHKLYYRSSASLNIRKMKYTVRVARSAEVGAYNILVRRNQMKKPLRHIDVGGTIIMLHSTSSGYGPVVNSFG